MPNQLKFDLINKWAGGSFSSEIRKKKERVRKAWKAEQQF